MGGWREAFEEVAATWRPAPTESADDVDAGRPAAFAALLDQPSPVAGPGDPLPPLWHWFLHLPVHRQADLGADGHPRRDGLLPPLPAERRRMFGGGRLRVAAPLRCGERVSRRSQVASCRVRQGGSGPLLLTTLRHTLEVDGELRVSEEQDIVYVPPREPGQAGGAPPGDADQPEATDRTGAHWALELTTDPVLLFRFSALTANAHRIHYDRAFAQQVEGHADLVVHGPLSALLLLELPRRHAPERQLTELTWRAHRPAHVGQLLRATGRMADGGGAVELALRAGTAGGVVTATATLVPPGGP